MEKFTIEYKEDIWKIPIETKIMKILCKLNLHAAEQIITKCRELEKLIISASAWDLMDPPVKQYLENHIYIQIEGKPKQHPLNREEKKKIQFLYQTGGHNLETLANEFNISKNEVWEALKERPFKDEGIDHLIKKKKVKKK